MSAERFDYLGYSNVMRANLSGDGPPLPQDKLLNCLPEIDNTRLRLVILNTPARDFTGDPLRGSPRNLRPPVGEYYLQASVDRAIGDNTSIVLDMDKYRLAPTDAAAILKLLNKRVGSNLTIGLNMFSPNRHLAFTTARILREACPDSLIIFGGRGTTLEKGRMLKEFDGESPIIAVLGEAEGLLPRILQSGWEGRQDIIVTTQNVDNPPTAIWLPINTVEQLPLPVTPPYPATHGNGHNYSTGLTSRSCPYQCDFCAASTETPYRQHSLSYLLRLLQGVPIDESGTSYLDLLDDHAWVNHKRAMELTNLFKGSKSGGQPFVWRLLARADMLVREAESDLLADAKEQGLEEIGIGVEARTPEILRVMNKKESPEITDQAVKLVLRNGIRAKVFTMIGYEGESREQIQTTIDWLTEMKRAYPELFRYSLFITAPYYGTKLYERLLQRYPPWALQLYTEAVSTGNSGLIEEVDRLSIKLSELSLGVLFKIAKETDEALESM